MRSPRDLAEEQARLIAVSLILIATVAVGAGLAYMRPALVPFVLAVFVYYLVSPLADLLETKARFPRWASTVTTLLVVAGLIALMAVLVTTSVRGLLNSADLYQERLLRITRQVTELLDRRGLEVGQDALLESIQAFPISQVVPAAAGTALTVVSNGFLVMIFVIFLLLGRQPGRFRSQVFREIDAGIRRFLGIKLAISAATGVLVGAILALLGLELALVFGVLTFLLNFIPSVGSIVAVLLPLPVALVQFESYWPVVGVFVLPAIVQLVIGSGIDPKLTGRGLDLSPVTVLIALVFWGLIWGVVGMLLAAPMTGILRIVLAQFATTRPMGEILAGRFPQGTTGTWPVPGQATAAEKEPA
ncbi:MAG: AI-2E family transporter [Gemmatimonadales bacterium]|nr:AI-2E family transporter [Gemmatimonadales bacterium]